MNGSWQPETLLMDGRRYQTLVEAIADYAIFMLDARGYVSTWNPGARRFKGYESSEIIGEHFSRFYTDEDRDAKVPERVLETARQEGRFESEGLRVRKDGSRFWAHVVIAAIHDDGGSVVGFAKITRDLTARKLAQEQLRQAEEQFRILVQGVTDYAIFMLDPTGHVSSWNSGAERIKGYSREDILGQHFSRFYTVEDRNDRVPERALDTARRDGRFESENWRVRKDGSRFWAHVVIDAIHDEEGKLIGFAKVTHDSSERHADRLAMEAFTYTASHDLRAPLRGIEGFARILLNDFAEALGPAGRRYAERIVAAADRMQGQIADLLAFSRVQRVDIKLHRVEPVRILQRQAEQARALADSSGAVIELLEPLPAVCAEPTVLELTFANLLANAVKFHRRGQTPRIRVRAEANRGRVRFWIEDEGIGIAPEHQERIFGAFERLHGHETYPGSGMGLAIVKTGIERMGGTVGVVSQAGQGAQFWIELSRADPDC